MQLPDTLYWTTANQAAIEERVTFRLISSHSTN